MSETTVNSDLNNLTCTSCKFNEYVLNKTCIVCANEYYLNKIENSCKICNFTCP